MDPRHVYARDLTSPGETRQDHARAVARGAEVRVHWGVYFDAVAWQSASFLARYLLLIRAICETRASRPVLSHWSAAAIHGLHIVGEWPDVVHITQSPGHGSRSHGRVVRHSLILHDSDVEEVDGMLVTTVARTVVDIAAASTTLRAVVLADSALHVDSFQQTPGLTTTSELVSAWERKLPFTGYARSKDVIDFAVDAADSPLESVSRVNMRLIGCPAPELQVQHFDNAGFIAQTDFTWRAYRLVGEADGEQKYLDPKYREGRSVERVVLDEKYREDRLRALRLGVVRWPWKVAIDPSALARRLKFHGLPVRAR